MKLAPDILLTVLPKLAVPASMSLTLGLAFGIASAATAAEESRVTFRKTEHSVEIRTGGEPFTVFHFADDLPKPFFAPVHAPGGGVITRPIFFSRETPERFHAQQPEIRGRIDHPHQKGVWLAIDEVSRVNFWAEQGRIENQSVDFSDGNPGTLRVVNHWLDREGQPLLVETTTIAIHPERLMAWDIRFTPASREVVFADTKEGMFGIRLVDSMREQESGKVVNSDGLEGTANCWGRTADWVDYSGPVDGTIVGVALFDHPDNFRKSRYHVRNYGLFTMSPFGESAYTNGREEEQPVQVKPGETLRLRYGLYVHAGDAREGRVAEAHRKFVAAE